MTAILFTLAVLLVGTLLMRRPKVSGDLVIPFDLPLKPREPRYRREFRTVKPSRMHIAALPHERIMTPDEFKRLQGLN